MRLSAFVQASVTIKSIVAERSAGRCLLQSASSRRWTPVKTQAEGSDPGTYADGIKQNQTVDRGYSFGGSCLCLRTNSAGGGSWGVEDKRKRPLVRGVSR